LNIDDFLILISEDHSIEAKVQINFDENSKEHLTDPI